MLRYCACRRQPACRCSSGSSPPPTRAATSFWTFNRKRELRIRGHPLDDRRHLVRVVARARDSLQRVAVRARADGGLLLLGARKAREPLRVGELRREIASRRQFQIGRRGLAGVDLHVQRPFEVVADGSNAKGIRARLQSGRGKTIAALRVAHDGDRDRRRRALRAHEHAFHRALFDRCHAPAERGRRLGLPGRRDGQG